MKKMLRCLFVLAVLLGQAEQTISAQESTPFAADILREVMPGADRFDSPSGSPPVALAWRTGDDGKEVLVGYVFHTTEVPPERRGYSGPIEAMVGMDLQGRLTGVRVTNYWESIMSSMGDFLRRPGVQEQFRGKHVGEPFTPYRDVEAVSRATISTQALGVGVRDAARRVANAYLSAAIEEGDPLAPVEELSWLQLRQRGVVVPMEITGPNQGAAEVTLIYRENDAFADLMVGPSAATMSQRLWENNGSEGHVLFYGIDGADVMLFRREGWSVVQDGDTTAIPSNSIRSFGLAAGGMLDEQVVTGGVMIVSAELDVRRAFRMVFQVPDVEPAFSIEYRTELVRTTTVKRSATYDRDGSVEAARVAGIEGRAVERLADVAAVTSDVSGSVVTEGVEDVAKEEISTPPAIPLPSTTTDVAAELSETVPARADASVDGLESTELDNSVAPRKLPSGAGLPSVGSLPTAGNQAVPMFEFEESETLLQRTLANTRWDRMVALGLLLCLVLIAFLRKNEKLRWGTLGATLLFLGYYDGGFLSVSHITSAILVGPGVFLNDLPLLTMVVFTVVTTLVWGRVFCGYLCPFGAIQDFLARIVPRSFQRSFPEAVHRKALYLKYGVLALIVGFAFAGSQIRLYSYFEPFGTVFFGTQSMVLWLIAGAFLIASAVIPRFYCRYACPLGAALAVGSVISLKRIDRVPQCTLCKVCEQHCPTGAISTAEIDFKECVRCNDCEIQLIEKTGVCRHDMDVAQGRLVKLRTSRAEVA